MNASPTDRSVNAANQTVDTTNEKMNKDPTGGKECKPHGDTHPKMGGDRSRTTQRILMAGGELAQVSQFFSTNILGKAPPPS